MIRHDFCRPTPIREAAMNPGEHPAVPPPPAWLTLVRDSVRGVRFGVVQIVIHDSRVVQIERTERTRCDDAKPAAQGGGEARA
jgi:hypothetical protein